MSNFSFSLRVFKRLVLQTPKNKGLFGKGLIFTMVAKITIDSTRRVNPSSTIQNFNDCERYNAGKVENAGNKRFLLFPHCFVLFEIQKLVI